MLSCSCIYPSDSLISIVSCPSASCRHATISKFFGDKLPNCAGACDFCRNPKAVRAQLERAAALSTKTEAQSKEPRGPFGFQPDLYEGGRKGYGFERWGRSVFSSLMERSSRPTLTVHLAGMTK